MTKVTLHYDLSRPLSDSDLENIAKVHGTYGIVRVRIEPSPEKLTVDYDASRLLEREVEAVLRRHGLPIHTRAVA